MRSSTVAAIAASAFLSAASRTQAQLPDLNPPQGALTEPLTPPRTEPIAQNAWQQSFAVSDAYPDAEWVKDRRALISAGANWEPGGLCAITAAYLGISAKPELMAIVDDPKAPLPAVAAAAKILFRSGDEPTLVELAVAGLRKESPLMHRYSILAAFSEGGDARTLTLAKDLLAAAGAAAANAKDENRRAQAIGFACAVLAELDHDKSNDARDGLYFLLQDERCPVRLRAQAAVLLSARPSLEPRHTAYLYSVCEGKEFECPPEAAVITATHLVYKHRASDHSEIFLKTLQKHIDALPKEIPLNVVCVALESCGGAESMALLQRLASSPRLADSGEAINSLKLSGAGSQVPFLESLGRNDKIALPLRIRAVMHAVMAEAEQNNFNLPQGALDSFIAKIKDASLPHPIRAAYANAVMNAHTVATERGFSIGDTEPAKRELKFLDQLSSLGSPLPQEVVQARRVRIDVDGSMEPACAAVLTPTIPPDWRSGIYRGIAAADPQRGVALLSELVSREGSSKFNFSPFLLAVERSDSTPYVPCLERIVSRGTPNSTADQYKAVDLIASAAPRVAGEALARIAEDGAVPFSLRGRALVALTAVDRVTALPIAEKFAASPVWILQEAGEVALTAQGNPAATERTARRFTALAAAANPNLELDQIPLQAYARALASSGLSEAWKALDPYLRFNTDNRSPAAKSGIEEALRLPQYREAFFAGLNKFAEETPAANLDGYAAALSRVESLGFRHPLRYSPQSLVKIVAARENSASIETPITAVFVSRGDGNGALYHSAAIIQQLHDQAAGSILVYEFADESDLARAAADVAPLGVDGKPVRTAQNVIWLQHGAKLRASLDGPDPRAGVILDPRKEIDAGELVQFGQSRRLVAAGGAMFFIECSAGEPGDEQHGQNMVKAARAAFPELRPEGSIGPEVPIKFKNVQLKFSPTGELIDIDVGGRKLKAQADEIAPAAMKRIA